MTTQTTVSSLLANVAAYQYNPAAIQSTVLKTLSDITDGTKELVDPTNPFVFALETSAVLTAAGMSKNEANTRKQYPFAAQTPEDLYLHMSDVDYVNRFAIPTSTVFSMLIPLQEVLDKMVINPLTNTKMLVLPRNSYFTVANVIFSIQYPIVIEQLQHGGLHISYDTTNTSPLQTLASNVIQHELKQGEDGVYISFDFDVQQFSIITQSGSLNSALDFSVDVFFSDQYYYTRVYVENADGTWSEIRTTHTDQIYDVKTPTAVLQVVNSTTSALGGVVNVRVPQIYTATGMLNRGIRIDVYETKGPLELVLWEFPFNAFSVNWLAIDPNDSTDYTAPLSTFNTIIPYSTNVVTGGSNAKTFEQLREQVITNAIGAPSLPITNAQIANAITINGYSIVKNIDNITNRVFLATKGMPAPTDKSLITPAASNISTINATINQLIQIATVKNNLATNQSITITPDTLYKNVNGVVKPLSSSDLTTLLSQSNDAIAQNVSNGKYMYTPFHYVLDMSNNEFNVRPYYLDAPEILTQLFKETNASTLLQVNTGAYSISRTATGYMVTVVTLSGTTYQALPDAQCFAQLSFIPEGERIPAYINGTFAGTAASGERIFTFDLSTNFNVDSNDYIYLSKFLMYLDQPRLAGAPLTTDFNIVYSTTAPMGHQWIASNIDYALGTFLLPPKVVGITNEVLRVRFGYSLDTLWARSRSVITSIPYKTWPVDVMRTYEKDVYATDANGSVVTFVGGVAQYNLLHAKGSPVLDSGGNPTYLHRAGDVVLNAYGEPITSDVRDMLRQLDILLIEGAYWFANDSVANNYRKVITQSMLEWLTNDLVAIEGQLLEQSNIYFYPSATLGSINALVDNGVLRTIDASQTFNINLSVPSVVYNDSALRNQLTNATIATIANQLKNITFSIDSITTALKGVYGADVTSIQVEGLGGTNNFSVITVQNNSQRCSIAKRLVSMPDASLIVAEAVTVNFILYQP